MDLHLENKVVLVTGGAKGIGAAIVRTCAAEAAIPVIVDRDAEASKKLHAEVHISHVIIADLSSPTDCRKAVDSTVEKFGRLDALVLGRRGSVGGVRRDVADGEDPELHCALPAGSCEFNYATGGGWRVFRGARARLGWLVGCGWRVTIGHRDRL